MTAETDKTEACLAVNKPRLTKLVKKHVIPFEEFSNEKQNTTRPREDASLCHVICTTISGRLVSHFGASKVFQMAKQKKNYIPSAKKINSMLERMSHDSFLTSENYNNFIIPLHSTQKRTRRQAKGANKLWTHVMCGCCRASCTERTHALLYVFGDMRWYDSYHFKVRVGAKNSIPKLNLFTRRADWSDTVLIFRCACCFSEQWAHRQLFTYYCYSLKNQRIC